MARYQTQIKSKVIDNWDYICRTEQLTKPPKKQNKQLTHEQWKELFKQDKLDSL